MVLLIAATFLVAGVGLALTPYVLLVEDITPKRWTPMDWDWLIQIAAWSLMLLAAAVEGRRQAARREEVR